MAFHHELRPSAASSSHPQSIFLKHADVVDVQCQCTAYYTSRKASAAIEEVAHGKKKITFGVQVYVYHCQGISTIIDRKK